MSSTNFGLNSEKSENFGRYKTVKLLGQGAMGRVYLAEDPVLERLVAIKVIALERSFDSATQQEYLQRFAFEARASAKLNHPSIVAVYDAGEQNNVPWIAFEYVQGERLDQSTKRIKQFSFDKVCSTALQIASALNHAHENHIIHRDVKPANILIDSRTGIAKLADFGVIKAPWIGLTQSGVSVGSPGYMSPEQIDGSEIDSRSDLFSLGVVLYEMLTGKHPFVRDSVPATFFATINGTYESVKNSRHDVPVMLENIIIQLLQPNRDERIPTAEVLISLLQDCLDSQPKNSDSIDKKTPEKVLFQTVLKKIISSCSKLFSFTKSVFVQNNLPNYLKKTGKFSNQILIFVKKSLILTTKQFHRLINFSVSTIAIQYAKNKRATIFTLIIFSAVITISLIELFRHETNQAPVKKNLQYENILQVFNQYLTDENFDGADSIAHILAQNRETLLISDLCFGNISLKKRYYLQADTFFNHSIIKMPQVYKYQLPTIINTIESIFKEGEAPLSLINLCVQTLHLHKTRLPGNTSTIAHNWLNNSHYWVRWNTVKIMETAGEKIDMIAMYLLDLETAASLRTRIRAAEKLGDSDDPRVVAPLEDVAGRGIRDPFVSAAARDALSKYRSRHKQN